MNRYDLALVGVILAILGVFYVVAFNPALWPLLALGLMFVALWYFRKDFRLSREVNTEKN
jgi:hypothetical protein